MSNMQNVYKYENSMQQCDKLLKRNVAKLNIRFLKHEEPSLSEFTEMEDEFIIIEKNLDDVQENIVFLKSEYNSSTDVSLPKLYRYDSDAFMELNDNCMTTSFSNEYVEELTSTKHLKSTILRASSTSPAFESIKSSQSLDLGDNVSMKECFSTTFLETKREKQFSSSKRNTALSLGKGIVCKICGRSFVHKKVLKRHMILHSGLKPFECPECDKSFARKDNMKLHLLSQHTPYHTWQYKCDICGKRFVSQSKLHYHKHVNEQHSEPELFKFSPPDVGGSVTVEKCDPTILLDTKKAEKTVSSKQNKTSNLGQATICNICGRNFCDRRSLRRHTFLHEELKPFSCAECGKSFSRKDNMRSHILEVHFPHQRFHYSHYNCTYCNRRYLRKSTLSSHIKAQHSSNINVEEFR